MHSIYLLRHCDYANPRNILPGRLPLELSEKGNVQAQQLKHYFRDKKIGKIYSSAVLRCRQTAEIISDSVIPIIFDQRILETFSAYQGYWDENRHSKGWHAFSHKKELGGEGLVDIQKRMVDFWEEINKDVQENCIICSHGDPLQTLYAYIHHIPLLDDNYNLPQSPPGWLKKGEFAEIVLSSDEKVE